MDRSPPAGFPVALTSFIGRAAELRDVAGLLEKHRLVTVTGPGGAGKTRLAAEVVRQMADRFTDGVWLAELAPIRDPTRVAATVATALGLHGGALTGEDPDEALAEAVRGRHLLLVLDNCEHVIISAARLCSALLRTADDVRVLATSREPLRIAGEQRYRLGPLPAEGAVTLFASRAREADAEFTLDEQIRPLVEQLVARLDGMPLAIELAAARVEALGVAQLLDRIHNRFELLVAGDRAAPDRQRSLAATVEWSYQLLTGREQAVFRALSVFPGPFPLEGAEAVAGPGAELTVLSMVDCSLLTPPRTGPDGRSRYVMPETVRSYGAELLARAGEAPAADAALARFALAVAEEAATGLVTRTWEGAGLRHMDADAATLDHALAWAAEHNPMLAARMAQAMSWWWVQRGRLTGHRSLLRALAERVKPGSGAWCAAHLWLGQACTQMADPVSALEQYTLVIDALGARGDQALPIAQAAGLGGRATALLALGRIPEASADARRSLELSRQTGDEAGEATALVVLALAVCRAGDLAEGIRLARQAMRITGEIPGSIARMRSQVLAVALAGTGELGPARDVCAEGLAQARELDDLWNLGGLLACMTRIDLLAGRDLEATAHMREQLQIALRTGGAAFIGMGVRSCARLCSRTGRDAEAVTLDAAASSAQVTVQPLGSPLLWMYTESGERDWLETSRYALGPQRALAAEERGAGMSLHTAAEYALLLTADKPVPPDAPAGAAPGTLSARERELVVLVAQGCTNAQIASRLFISPRTVGSHLDRIRNKTGCRRRADLTRLALTAGLI